MTDAVVNPVAEFFGIVVPTPQEFIMTKTETAFRLQQQLESTLAKERLEMLRSKR